MTWLGRTSSWWRPVIGWLCVPAVPYILYVGPALGRPLTEGLAIAGLAFVGGVCGLRSFDKIKGVAPGVDAQEGAG